MENYYLTEHTSSIDEYSKSLEYLLSASKVSTLEKSNKFRSFGNGILSKGFFLGHNTLEHIAEINLQDSKSCIFSIPLKGKYITRVSNRTFKTCTPETGIIFVPSESVDYLTNDDFVDDLMIVVDYDELAPLLSKNYGIHHIAKGAFHTEMRSKKVQVIYNLIVNKIQALELFPHLRESLHFKASIKEVAKLLLAENIADSLNASFQLCNTPGCEIVKHAEELMECNPEKYFSIQEIAEEVFTSTRNLQLAFKKHRTYTPMHFLRERKLHKARLMLIDPNPNTMIKSTAFECGFLNLSSFSNYYRKVFGELPSETLQKAK